MTNSNGTVCKVLAEMTGIDGPAGYKKKRRNHNDFIMGRHRVWHLLSAEE